MARMGDETMELLNREADQWNHGVGSPSQTVKSSNGLTRPHTEKDSHEQLLPGRFTDGPTHSQPLLSTAAPKKHQTSENGTTHTSGNFDSNSFSPNTDRIKRSLQNISGGIHTSSFSKNRKPPTKKQKTSSNSSHEYENIHNNHNGEDLPALRLDPDLELILEEEEPRLGFKQPLKGNKPLESHESLVSANNANGLKLRVPKQSSSPTRLSDSSPTSAADHKIYELISTLEAKDREIETLKAELSSLRTERQVELGVLAKELHTGYSKQASKKLRLLYRKAEKNAHQKVEESTKHEIDELRKQVDLERSEKAELVKACDDYLKLNGF